ncbi:MAG TPA: hypothetical protein PK521_03270, partial [Bacteroidales bacterium]|nr:hypothetical protein [Bacteroidales bacterium]HQM68303.1 hypothetical protein [Bacteroidales bacterium]
MAHGSERRPQPVSAGNKSHEGRQVTQYILHDNRYCDTDCCGFSDYNGFTEKKKYLNNTLLPF